MEWNGWVRAAGSDVSAAAMIHASVCHPSSMTCDLLKTLTLHLQTLIPDWLAHAMHMHI